MVLPSSPNDQVFYPSYISDEFDPSDSIYNDITYHMLRCWQASILDSVPGGQVLHLTRMYR